MVGYRPIKSKSIDKYLANWLNFTPDEIGDWSGFAVVVGDNTGLEYNIPYSIIDRWQDLDSQSKMCIAMVLMHIKSRGGVLTD